jgi:hypothetical protein
MYLCEIDLKQTMKNVHVLPTNKPSILHEFGNIWFSHKEPTECFRNYEIYITSNEEIKEGDWKLFGKDNELSKATYDLDSIDLKYNKKVILTTDQDLIKDGVRAIDDEFLEWFVKNPSCESVEIECSGRNCIEEYGCTKEVCNGVKSLKIIIPKETLNLDKLESKLDDALENETKESLTEWLNSKRNKQETLEEVAERFYPLSKGGSMWMPSADDCNKANKQEGFIEGAKWQAERMYSAEDMLNFALFLEIYLPIKPRKTHVELLEQFKKINYGNK